MSQLPDHYRLMARYNAWMNQKLLAAAAELTPEDWSRDLGAFFRSVKGTFNHLLLADLIWLARLTGDQTLIDFRDAAGMPRAFTGLDMILYEDLASFARARAALDQRLQHWVGELDAATLERVFRYQTTAGSVFEHPIWWALSHLFNHQTHHRGQLTTLLKQLGKDPGVTDLLVLLREGM